MRKCQYSYFFLLFDNVELSFLDSFIFVSFTFDIVASATYGSKMLALNLGLRLPYIWKFIVAKVHQPTIGGDFLKHHGLLVDPRHRRILDDYRRLQRYGQINTITQPSITTVDNSNNSYKSLLKQYIDVTRPTQILDEPKYKIRHHIIAKGRLCTERARRLAAEKYKTAHEEF